MASIVELEEVEAELIGGKGNPSPENLIKFLRLVRELKIRDSDSTARYGSIVLRNYKSHLSEEELWLVHEQVAIAALDSGALPFASSVIRAVGKKFPASIRTQRLMGMFWEASGNLERAEDLYNEVLRENPSNEIIAKRLVALEKTRGSVPAVIEALKKYLEIFANDREAWEELAEVYLEALMYRQALFCYEELLMFAPTHTPYLVRYADVLYTMGGSSANYRMARAYYAKTVELTAGQSPRALFGVIACCGNITDKVSLQDSRTRAQIEIPDLTAQALIKLYRTHAPDKLALLLPMLEKQGLV